MGLILLMIRLYEIVEFDAFLRLKMDYRADLMNQKTDGCENKLRKMFKWLQMEDLQRTTQKTSFVWEVVGCEMDMLCDHSREGGEEKHL